MKRLLGMLLLCLTAVNAQETLISRGGLTEALFIIKNKQNDLTDHITRLKEMLSQCLSLEKEQATCSSLYTVVEGYQCSFKEKLFLTSIKELEELLEVMNKAVLDLSQKEQLTQPLVQSHVDRAFLVKQKIDTEFLLIKHLLKIHQEKKSLQKTTESLAQAVSKQDTLKKIPSASRRILRSLRSLERNIAFFKRVQARLQLTIGRTDRLVKNLQSTLHGINKELYMDSEEERSTLLLTE